MEITVDITGMYYRHTVTMDTPDPTVFEVMQKAALTPAPNGGVMSFKTEDSAGRPAKSVNCITVDYDATSKPTSRQLVDPGDPHTEFKDPERPTGTYTFNDNVNVIPPQAGVSFRLAWQYYITNEDPNTGIETIKNKGRSGGRGIVKCKVSNKGIFGITLADGDTITWRLVAIYGLEESVAKKNPGANMNVSPRELKNML